MKLMSIKEQLMEDYKQAMRDKNKLVKDVLTMTRAAIKQKEVDTRTELSEEDVLDVIAKQVKQKRDSIEEFNKGGRPDLVELTESEIEILQKYLPEPLSDDELEAIVLEAIAATGACTPKDMGKVMGHVVPKTKGRADGGRINQIVRKHLN